MHLYILADITVQIIEHPFKEDHSFCTRFWMAISINNKQCAVSGTGTYTCCLRQFPCKKIMCSWNKTVETFKWLKVILQISDNYVKVKGKVKTKIKACRGVEVEFHLFLAMLCGYEWSASPDAPVNKAPLFTDQRARWAPQPISCFREENEVTGMSKKLNHNSSVFQPIT